MKSKTRKSYLAVYILYIVVVCGLLSGLIYDSSVKLPIWGRLALTFIVIAYPIFTIYSLLSIPSIELKADKLVSNSFGKKGEIFYSEVEKIIEYQFFNKIYHIGKYFTVYSKKGTSIAIPYKIYENEKELLSELRLKIQL